MKKLLLLLVISIWFMGCDDDPTPIKTCGGVTCEDWQECKEDKCELKDDFCETNENCTAEKAICGEDHKCIAEEVCDPTCQEWETCLDTECKLTDGRCNTTEDCTDSKICDNHNCVAVDVCDGFSCPDDSSCSVVDNKATCICDNGFNMKDGVCVAVDICDGFSCPDDSSCSVVDNKATCICDNGFNMKDGVCVAIISCDNVICGDFSTCSVVDNEAICVCDNGYEMQDGSCVAITSCDNFVCGDFSTCQIINEIATCVCDADYHLEGVSCVSNTKNVPCDSSNIPANADTTVVNVVITWNTESNSWTSPANCEWSCKTDFVQSGDQCIPVATCDPICEEWQICNNGSCEVAEGRCENDGNCNGGVCGVDHNCIDLCADVECSDLKECNSSNGLCEFKDGRCEQTSDCSQNEICDVNNNCVSTIVCNPTCNDWETCRVNNQCELNEGRCNEDSDCAENQYCSDEHSCEDVVGCDPLCNDWESCNNGACEPDEGRCNENSDCDSNICAVGNRCYYPEMANKLLLSLTWDKPGDLDIRLRNQATYLDMEWNTGNSCYYANCKASGYNINWYDNADNNPVLTIDDMQGSGPEVIEIADFLPTTGYYTVGIHNYSLDPFAIATLKVYCKGYLVDTITTDEIARTRFLEIADIRVNENNSCEMINLMNATVVKPELCQNEVCSNHGECVLGVQSIYCECEDGYHAEGMNCVNGQDPCEGISCGDNGACSVNQDGEAICICQDGYHAEGLTCVINSGDIGCTVLTSEECGRRKSCEPGDPNSCEFLGTANLGEDCNAENRCSSSDLVCVDNVCKTLCDPSAENQCTLNICNDTGDGYGYCLL